MCTTFLLTQFYRWRITALSLQLLISKSLHNIRTERIIYFTHAIGLTDKLKLFRHDSRYLRAKNAIKSIHYIYVYSSIR